MRGCIRLFQQFVKQNKKNVELKKMRKVETGIERPEREVIDHQEARQGGEWSAEATLVVIDVEGCLVRLICLLRLGNFLLQIV